MCNTNEAIELQIDSTGVIEYSYNPLCIRGLQLFNSLHADCKISELELISCHPKDGINYLEDTIVAVVNHKPSKDLIERFKLDKDLCDYYAVSKDRYKFYYRYDSYVIERALSILPNCELAKEFGYSYTPGSLFTDYYFYTDRNMFDYFGFVEPEESKKYKDELNLYAVTCYRFEVLKLKRYVYPGHSLADRELLFEGLK